MLDKARICEEQEKLDKQISDYLVRLDGEDSKEVTDDGSAVENALHVLKGRCAELALESQDVVLVQVEAADRRFGF